MVKLIRNIKVLNCMNYIKSKYWVKNIRKKNTAYRKMRDSVEDVNVFHHLTRTVQREIIKKLQSLHHMENIIDPDLAKDNTNCGAW